MKRLNGDAWIGIEFKPQDLWVGAFWDYKDTDYATARGQVVVDFHLWICILPMVPIHFIKASKYLVSSQ